MTWLRARGRFFSAADARVFLEAQLRLDSRLTAAAAGLVAWPEPVEKLPRTLRWSPRAPLGWLAAGAALLAVALLAPVPADTGVGPRAGKPPSLQQTEAMIAALQELKLPDPAALEQLAQKEAELARRAAAEQYSHSALEAADSLRDQTAAAAASLGRGLSAAAAALKSPEHGASMKDAAGRLAASLSGLRDGGLPPNADLLKQLGDAAADLSSLSAEQRAALSQQLAEAGEMAKGVAGAAGSGAKVERPDPNHPANRGDGTGGPGAGSDGSDGETAPLTFYSDASNAEARKSKSLSGADLRRTALGDKLGETTGAHEVDPTKAEGPMSAGAIAAPAAGGEVVWVNRLTPAERAALKKHFK